MSVTPKRGRGHRGPPIRPRRRLRLSTVNAASDKSPRPLLSVRRDGAARAGTGYRIVDMRRFAAAVGAPLASTDHAWGTRAEVRHVATLGVPPPHDPHDRV